MQYIQSDTVYNDHVLHLFCVYVHVHILLFPSLFFQCVASARGRKEKKNADNKLLVVYPFGVDEAILREAASGLKELRGDLLRVGSHSTESTTDTMQDDSIRRTNYITIREDDMERLGPGKLLNDTLVDFWMRW